MGQSIFFPLIAKHIFPVCFRHIGLRSYDKLNERNNPFGMDGSMRSSRFSFLLLLIVIMTATGGVNNS